MYFRYLCNYLSLEKGGALYLNNLESPFTQGHFMPSLVEIGPVVLEKKIFKRCQFIFSISQLSHLWERSGHSFEQTWIPFTQEYFVPSMVEIGPVVLEKKMKMWKVYKQTDGWTDLRRTTGDQKCSLELSAHFHFSDWVN